MKSNYLFGPFVGETAYELNYFVGHAIFLRKKFPKNRIIVLTRKEHFDLYGKYATTFVPLPICKDLVPEKFDCPKMQLIRYEDMANKFKQRYKNQFKIHGHFYPRLSTYLKDLKWHYPRKEIDFDFKPRNRNIELAENLIRDKKNIIFSEFHLDFEQVMDQIIIPYKFVFEGAKYLKGDATILGVVIEIIRRSKYVYADIDSIVGRLAMLMKKPMITRRDKLDVKYLSPINPYSSTVIGCKDLQDGIRYLEEKK